METLADWYDAAAPAEAPGLTVQYTCVDGTKEEIEHVVQVTGQNNRGPIMEQADYSASIPRLLPPSIPLHYVDQSFNVFARDEVNIKYHFMHPGRESLSIVR